MPSRAVLFKIMKACIGVNKISELWIYEEQEGEYSLNSDDSMSEEEHITVQKGSVGVHTNTDESDFNNNTIFRGGKRYS